MTSRCNLFCLVLTSLALSAALAEEDPVVYGNHVELGIGYTGDDNQKFGEFADQLDDEGVFVVGSLRLESALSGGASKLYADVLKDPFNTSGSLGYSRAGKFSIEAYGGDSQKIEAKDFYLPTTYIDAPDHTVIANLTPHDFMVERTTSGVRARTYLGTAWVLTAGYQHQEKDGDKTIAGPDHGPVVGRAVNFEHDEVSMGVEFNSAKLALGAHYYVSNFSDDDIAFEYCDIGIACGSAIAAEPGNEFRRLQTDARYSLGERTTVHWLGSWSTGEQDDHIVLSTSPLRFDGKIDRFHGRLTLVSSPVRNLNYKLEYVVRDHDTRHDPIRGIDVGYTSRSGGSTRISSVYDKEQATIKAEIGYRFPNRSRLRAGWERDDIERTRSTYLDDSFTPGEWIDDTQEDVFWVDYRVRIAGLQLQAKAEAARRDGDQDQNPDWQALYNFDRDRDTYSLFAALPVGDQLLLSAGYSATQEDYSPNWEPGQMPGEYAGIDYRDSDTANVDLSFYPSEGFGIALYALWTRFEHRQVASRFYASRDPRDDDEFDYQGRDEVDVYGLNLNWQVSPRLRIEADFAVSMNDNELGTAGVFIPLDSDGNATGPATAYDETLPGYGADTTRLDLLASLQLNPTTRVYARLLYENWDIDDLTFTGELLHDDGELAQAWNADDGNNSAIIVGLRKDF